MVNIGGTIRMIRNQRGLNQKKLAVMADISESYLCLIEQGKRDPSLSTLESISAALSLPFVLLVFLATDQSAIKKLDQSLAEKLAYISLQLINSDPKQK